MKLFLATNNKHKVDEISTLLSDYGVDLRQAKLDLIEPDFGSLEEIANYKAKQAFAKLKKPVIAEDTGVYFCGYNNFPGILAKRVFLGIGFDGLVTLIRHSKNKKAYFKTVVSYFDGKKLKSFSGVLKGRLLERVVSIEKDRLPYEKIFVPDGFSKALVDIPLDEKNKFSHRAKAVKKFGNWLKSL
jgi:XTP/dITP diphosphohydrolase